MRRPPSPRRHLVEPSGRPLHPRPQLVQSGRLARLPRLPRRSGAGLRRPRRRRRLAPRAPRLCARPDQIREPTRPDRSLPAQSCRPTETETEDDEVPQGEPRAHARRRRRDRALAGLSLALGSPGFAHPHPEEAARPQGQAQPARGAPRRARSSAPSASRRQRRPSRASPHTEETVTGDRQRVIVMTHRGEAMATHDGHGVRARPWRRRHVMSASIGPRRQTMPSRSHRHCARRRTDSRQGEDRREIRASAPDVRRRREHRDGNATSAGAARRAASTRARERGDAAAARDERS